MTWEMGDKVVNIHSSTIQFVPECYKTQKMCDKSFLPVFFVYFWWSFFNEICSWLIVETQEIRDKAVDHCLAALKFVPDCFVTSKMIKKLFTALCAGENRLYFDEDSGNVVFNCNGIGILIQLLIILTLVILVMMKIIQILWFISDFWKTKNT